MKSVDWASSCRVADTGLASRYQIIADAGWLGNGATSAADAIAGCLRTI
jgi:hypothetical protein